VFREGLSFSAVLGCVQDSYYSDTKAAKFLAMGFSVRTVHLAMAYRSSHGGDDTTVSRASYLMVQLPGDDLKLRPVLLHALPSSPLWVPQLLVVHFSAIGWEQKMIACPLQLWLLGLPYLASSWDELHLFSGFCIVHSSTVFTVRPLVTCLDDLKPCSVGCFAHLRLAPNNIDLPERLHCCRFQKRSCFMDSVQRVLWHLRSLFLAWSIALAFQHESIIDISVLLVPCYNAVQRCSGLVPQGTDFAHETSAAAFCAYKANRITVQKGHIKVL
jgi:hypothetical protein